MAKSARTRKAASRQRTRIIEALERAEVKPRVIEDLFVVETSEAVGIWQWSTKLGRYQLISVVSHEAMTEVRSYRAKWHMLARGEAVPEGGI